MRFLTRIRQNRRPFCGKRVGASSELGAGGMFIHSGRGPPPLPATRSARASASAWARSTSARAGIPAPPSASFRPLPARRGACGCRRDQTVHALGIAGTQSAGLMAAQYGAMVKRMHACRASQSGLYGALPASRGFTGIADVFEAPYGGFCTTFSRSQDRFDLNELSAGLGERFETMGVALKFYSCVGSNHTTSTPSATCPRGARSRPATSSASWCTARRSRSTTWAGTTAPKGSPRRSSTCRSASPPCYRGDVFVDQFRPEAVDARAHRAVARRSRSCTIPPSRRSALVPPQVRVEVHFRDGTVATETREAPRGSEQSFASEAEIVENFRASAAAAMREPQQDALIEAVLGLERLEDAGQLARLLRVG